MKKGDFVVNGGAPGEIIRVSKDWADVRWYPGHPNGWSKRMPLTSLEMINANVTQIVYLPSGAGMVFGRRKDRN